MTEIEELQKDRLDDFRDALILRKQNYESHLKALRKRWEDSNARESSDYRAIVELEHMIQEYEFLITLSSSAFSSESK